MCRRSTENQRPDERPFVARIFLACFGRPMDAAEREAGRLDALKNERLVNQHRPSENWYTLPTCQRLGGQHGAACP